MNDRITFSSINFAPPLLYCLVTAFIAADSADADADGRDSRSEKEKRKEIAGISEEGNNNRHFIGGNAGSVKDSIRDLMLFADEILMFIIHRRSI